MMHEIVHEDVTEAFLLCGFARPHGSYLRTMCTTYLPRFGQYIDYKSVKYFASGNNCV